MKLIIALVCLALGFGYWEYRQNVHLDEKIKAERLRFQKDQKSEREVEEFFNSIKEMGKGAVHERLTHNCPSGRYIYDKSKNEWCLGWETAIRKKGDKNHQIIGQSILFDNLVIIGKAMNEVSGAYTVSGQHIILNENLTFVPDKYKGRYAIILWAKFNGAKIGPFVHISDFQGSLLEAYSEKAMFNAIARKAISEL